jgi:hypothetical protein
MNKNPDKTGTYGKPAFSVGSDTFTKIIRNDKRKKGEWWKKFLGDSGIGNWKRKNKTLP